MVSEPLNLINFRKACRLAEINDVTNVIITGKGEPTLFPDQITDYLEAMVPFDFPVIELQTNGILFSQQPEKFDKYLKDWHDLGLTFIAISIIHYDPEINRANYIPHLPVYPDLEKIISNLHSFGYSVRLTVTLVKGGIDSAKEAGVMVSKARDWGVEQLTLRKVAAPHTTQNEAVSSWTRTHQLDQSTLDQMEQYLLMNGTKIASFDYGGAIYDVSGQNVCFTNALTLNKETETFRQAIYFPDGHLRFDWQYSGAIII